MTKMNNLTIFYSPIMNKPINSMVNVYRGYSVNRFIYWGFLQFVFLWLFLCTKYINHTNALYQIQLHANFHLQSLSTLIGPEVFLQSQHLVAFRYNPGLRYYLLPSFILCMIIIVLKYIRIEIAGLRFNTVVGLKGTNHCTTAVIR